MDWATSKAADALSFLSGTMFHTLIPSFLRSLSFLFDVEGDAEKLKSTVSRIQAVLNDTEDRQIKEETVRLWLSELKDAAYDAEDILDEFEYVLLRFKIEEEEEEAPLQTRKHKWTDQVSDLFSRYVSKLKMGPRIKEIRGRLEKIDSSSNLHLRVLFNSERFIPSNRPPTSSIIDESTVFGRETDREKVVGLLISDDSSAEFDIWVVPICGMGGVGKTTLAQLIYNDGMVAEHFDIRAWVYVSEDFDLIRLAKAIAESVTGSACHLTNLDAIQASIQKALSKKRFFLVLDDVWNENINDWDVLRAPLMVGARGSRILVTTRSQRVSSIVGTVPSHFLRVLSDYACWTLFERKAFVEGNSEAHPDLVKMGKEIVNKCCGLPLAVKTLGGLLRSKVDVVEWEAILKSEIWDLPEERNDILPVLKLSYHHLPAHLKRCFAYCACIFHKVDHEKGDEIVLMWMAQGFIQSNGSKQMEDIGREYLDDLCSRSLLDYDSSTSSYTMHDLVRDLARFVFENDLLGIGDQKRLKNRGEKVRHVLWHLSSAIVESLKTEDFYCLKSVRTLSVIFNQNIPADLFVNLRHICTLRLKGKDVTELPESIGNLLHLRYLDLSCMSIERLPESTTKLYHLQTLKLVDCQMLVELPSDFSNLVNLRHLFLEKCSISIVPRIGRLTSLRTFQKFTVGKEMGCRINELKGIIHLSGQLHISNLENVVSVEEAKDAELKKKQKIYTLHLEWKSDSVELRQEGIEEEVLNALQPHTNLKSLRIVGYCGVIFPTWLGDSLYSNLVSVYLYRCRCHLLPPFGQIPSLEHLHLEDVYGVKKVGHEICGGVGKVKAFPSLISFHFESMPDLEEWSDLEGDFKCVREIKILNCSKLRGLPQFPFKLSFLEICGCEKLATLPRSSIILKLSLRQCDEQILSSLQYRTLTSISSLEIHAFPNLTSLPDGLLRSLTSLEELTIGSCDQLRSLSAGIGLQHLTCLQSLLIDDCPWLISLGDELLPTALQFLTIRNCSTLNSLPTGLKNLTSLVKLELEFCPEIHFFPEELPITLQSLCIRDCPLLKEKYQQGGEYWSKISHIPKIITDEHEDSNLH